MLATGYSSERLGARRRRPLAGQTEPPRPPIPPGAAPAAKSEGGVTSCHCNFVAFADPLGGVSVGKMAFASFRVVPGSGPITIDPGTAALAPPGSLAKYPKVLVAFARRGCVPRRLPATQPGFLHRGEHRLRDRDRSGDERGPFCEELQGHLLVVGGLRVERHRFCSQSVSNGVGTDVSARGVVVLAALSSVSFDPADTGGLVAIARIGEMIHHDASIDPAWRERLASVGVGCSYHIVTVATNMGGPDDHPPGHGDAYLFPRL